MKLVTKSFLCGVTCFQGGSNCNNYFNHDYNKEIPDSPASYEQLMMDEIDMWKDVIEIIAEYIPQEKTVFEIIQSKYQIKPIEK